MLRPQHFAALVFFGVLAVYMPTIPSGIAGGDAGELAAAVCATGVPHAPGYPLWILLGKLAAVWPWGTVAWRLGVMTAVLGAGTAAMMAAFLTVSGVGYSAALLGVAAYAFSGNVWHYATAPEVFTLNSLLVMAALLASALGRAGLAGLALGLGLSNHFSGALLAAPAVAWAVCNGNWKKNGGYAVAGVLAGLLPYLYLPIAGARESVWSWGDPTTWAGFWHHVSRADYGAFQLASADRPAHFAANLGAYGTYLWTTLGPLLGLAALGVGDLARRSPASRQRWVWVIALAATLGYVVLFHAGANLLLEVGLHRQVMSRFWIMPEILLGLLVARGLWVVQKAAEQPAHQLGVALVLVAAVLALALPIARFNSNDRHLDYEPELYARAELDAMPKDSLVLVRDDMVLPLHYLLACTTLRPDVRLVNRTFLQKDWERPKVAKTYPDVTVPNPLVGLGPLIEANIDRHPILLNEFDPTIDEYREVPSWEGRFDVLPWGVMMRVERHQAARDWSAYGELSGKLLTAYEPPYGPTRDAWDEIERQVYAEAFLLRALYLTVAADTDPTAVAPALEAAAEMVKLPDVDQIRGSYVLGHILAIRARQDPSVWDGAVGAWRRYLQLTPATDPHRKEIEALIARGPQK